MAQSPKTNRREKAPKQRATRTRKTANARGYNHEWRRARLLWLQACPVCVECGWIDVPAKMVVDHILPHRGSRLLFWNRSNWQTMCKRCHDKKTGRGE